MGKIFTYSPREVLIDIGGYIITGWDNISIERSAESFVVVRGIRGKHTRVKNPDTSCTITIPLLQTSMTNDVLSKILQLDEQYGSSRIDITLKDKSGTSVFSSSEAYIMGYPAISYTGDFTYRTWKIFCQTTSSYTVGGNAQVKNIFSGLLDAASGAFDAASGVVDKASNAVTNLFN